MAKTHTSTGSHHTSTGSHHTSSPKPHASDGSPTHHESKPNTSHSSGGGAGGGKGHKLNTESLGTMEGHIGRTRDKVDGVGQKVAGANFGHESMGVVGTGMTGSLNSTVDAAKAQVAKTSKSVDAAALKTKAARQHYETNELNTVEALNKTGKDVKAPPVKEGSTTPSSSESTKPSSTSKTGSDKTTSSSGDGDGPNNPPPNNPPPPGSNNRGHTASDDELRGQYTRQSMQTRPTSTDQQIRDAATRLGYDPDAHIAKTLQPTANMSAADRAEIIAVRNELKANPGELMTKVVKPEMGEAMLRNDTQWTDADTGRVNPIDPGQIGGSVARGSDSAQHGTPQEFRDALALDDGGAGWSPIKAGANEAYQVRYPASPDPGSMDISYGGTTQHSADEMQRLSGSPQNRKWDPPFLGTGYTGGGVPEWLANRHDYAGRAEMWHVNADGTETFVGVHLPGRGWFDVRGMRGSGA